jgi:hypothetical protein
MNAERPPPNESSVPGPIGQIPRAPPVAHVDETIEATIPAGPDAIRDLSQSVSEMRREIREYRDEVCRMGRRQEELHRAVLRIGEAQAEILTLLRTYTDRLDRIEGQCIANHGRRPALTVLDGGEPGL